MKLKSFIHLFTESNDTFQGQEVEEKVVLILRKHIFIVYMQLAFYGITIFIPLIIAEVFSGFITSNNLWELFVFLTTLWYMFFWIVVFYSLTMYSLNVVVVTNHRIIDTGQLGFFNRKISELHLSRVQDISVHTNGIIETSLRFGTIEVQTASEQREFIFRQIPNPEQVKDVIMNLVASEHTAHSHQHPV